MKKYSHENVLVDEEEEVVSEEEHGSEEEGGVSDAADQTHNAAARLMTPGTRST